jgi:PST family polysaccharide transporter
MSSSLAQELSASEETPGTFAIECPAADSSRRMRFAALPTASREAVPRNYEQILKSSAVIGASSVLTIGVGIVRAKAIAVLLGPAGMGLIGLYTSIIELTRSVAGMGVNSSGVRQIAEAVGSGEAPRIATTAVVLRRVSIVLGLVGAAAVVLLRVPISKWTFGSTEFSTPVALLSMAVFFQLISDGQAALVQGMRRIPDLARIAVWTGVLGTGISLTLVYYFRQEGIVPALVASAVVAVLVSWWYRRRVNVPAFAPTVREIRNEAGALLALGSAFMASAVMTTGGAYLIRAYLANRIGIDAAGLYQSAWVLGGLYVGFILQSMGSDFYPRLTGMAREDDQCNRLVNEQAQISVLLAGPGVLATLTFAGPVIAIFYASTFATAVEPLRWICLGMALRVIAWPMGFIVLAKGARAIFFWADFAATIVHVGLAVLLARWFGVRGAAMGFFGLYVWHGVLIYFVVRRLTGFRWSTENRRIGSLFLGSIALVFLGFFVLPGWAATTFGAAAVVMSTIYSLTAICALVSPDRVPRFLLALAARFGPKAAQRAVTACDSAR